METLSLSEVKMKPSALVEEIDGSEEEIVITKNGRPVAVLVSADEFDRWKETVITARWVRGLELAPPTT